MNKGAAGTQDEIDLLRRAWPDRDVDEELALLRSLSIARRTKAMARLRALLAIEDARVGNPRAQVDIAAIARTAELTRDGLFSIRRKWAISRDLEALVPYLGRAERQPTQRQDDDPVVLAARRLIVEMAGQSDSMIASALKREFGLSLPVLIRLVRRLRRDDTTDPERITEVFGRALLVDLSAIDRVTPGDDPKAIVCALVVERASGWIFGFSVARADGDTLGAQLEAVRRARSFVRDNALDVSGGRTSAQVTLGDGPRFDAALGAAAALRADGIDLAVNSIGPRRYGTRLASLVGKRLGRLWWRPRSTSPSTSDCLAGEAIELADAAILVEAEVATHNADVEARLAEGGVRPGWGVADGDMGDTLDLVGAMLSGRVSRSARKAR